MFWKNVSLGMLLGFAVLLIATVMEAAMDVARIEPELLPELDDVTRWQLHREARAILEGGKDAV